MMAGQTRVEPLKNREVQSQWLIIKDRISHNKEEWLVWMVEKVLILELAEACMILASVGRQGNRITTKEADLFYLIFLLLGVNLESFSKLLTQLEVLVISKMSSILLSVPKEPLKHQFHPLNSSKLQGHLCMYHRNVIVWIAVVSKWWVLVSQVALETTIVVMPLDRVRKCHLMVSNSRILISRLVCHSAHKLTRLTILTLVATWCREEIQDKDPWADLNISKFKGQILELRRQVTYHLQLPPLLL